MRRPLTLILLLACCVPTAAVACSCVPPGTVEQEMARSTRVFLGRVTSVQPRTPEMDRDWFSGIAAWFAQLLGHASPAPGRDVPYRRVTFAVSETFKGSPVRQIGLATGMGGGDCGYAFDAAREYVVYAYGPDDALEAGICSRTRPASDPESGLATLRGRP